MFDRRSLLISSAAALGLAATGCKLKKSASLRVGYLPISESLPLFMAKSKGYFSDAGIDAQLLPLDGGAKIIAAIAGGSLDVGLSNYVSLILARDSGLRIKIISGSTAEVQTNPQHSLMIAPESKLTTKQLEGKRIAVNTRNNINELFVRAYMKKHGLNPDSVAYIEVPFPRMLSALESGAVDAAGCIEPFVTFAKDNNLAKPVAPFVVDVENGVPIAGWVGSETFIQDSGMVATQFKTAIQQALKDITNAPDEARALLPTFTSMTAAAAENVPLPSFDGATPPTKFSNLISRVASAGWLENDEQSIESYVAKV